MAQPTYIELQTGTDWVYMLAVWSAWLIAAVTSLVQSGQLAWPMRAIAFGLLLMLWPGVKRRIQRPGSLRLVRDGMAVLDGQEGTWGGYARSCRWYVLLGVDLPGRRQRVMLSASRNDPDEYRRLLMWVRLAPSNTDADPGLLR